MKENKGKLYVVATPIGNLSDLSSRAIATLSQVSLIAAEDTRHTATLLNHFGINTPTISLHDFNELQRIEQIVKVINQGQDVALVSDAGTPLISDPGFKLVNELQQQAVTISPIPGCCAAIAALSVAGQPTDRFCFEGFLPAKKQARLEKLKTLKAETRTMVFYESKHRIVDTMSDLVQIYPERFITLAKELTKAYEFVSRNKPMQLLAWLQNNPSHVKGEFVIIVPGLSKEQTLKPETLRALDILCAELPLKQAAALTAKLFNENKNAMYKLALERKSE